MRTNEFSDQNLESISDEDLQTVFGGLASAVNLATYETAVCISQL